MEPNKTTSPAETWLDTAVKKIRFKPDRREVRAELSAHLEDKALDLQRIFPDMTREEAQERAVSDMGDPAEVGKELAKVHKPWLGYLWRASQVLLALTILNFMAAVGTLRYDRDRGPELEGTVEAVFAGQEAVRVNTYTLWVEEASLAPGHGGAAHHLAGSQPLLLGNAQRGVQPGVDRGG